MIALVTVPALYNGSEKRTAAYPNMVSLVLLGAEVLITTRASRPAQDKGGLACAVRLAGRDSVRTVSTGGTIEALAGSRPPGAEVLITAAGTDPAHAK